MGRRCTLYFQSVGISWLLRSGATLLSGGKLGGDVGLLFPLVEDEHNKWALQKRQGKGSRRGTSKAWTCILYIEEDVNELIRPMVHTAMRSDISKNDRGPLSTVLIGSFSTKAELVWVV